MTKSKRSRFETYTCPAEGCGETFNHHLDYSRHAKDKHGDQRPFKCTHENCGKGFRRARELQTHLCYHREERPYSCPEENCTRAFKTVTDLHHHKAMHKTTYNFPCTYPGCEKSFKTFRDMSKHLRYMHADKDSFQCSFEGCVKTFRTKNDLNRHLQRHTERKTIPCPVEGCGKMFKFKTELVLHSRTHLTVRDFVCDIENCGRAFKTKEDLRKHKYIHNDTRPFNCKHPDCSKSFKSPGEAVGHYRAVHSNIRQHVCKEPGCDKAFLLPSQLKIHMRVHTGEKPYVCPHDGCGQRFRIVQGFRYHLLSHKKELFTCQVVGCGKTYQFQSSLRKHVQLKHTEKEKTFKCPKEGCDQIFRFKIELTVHMYKHGPRKRKPRRPCPISGCMRSFEGKTNLQNHVDYVHKKIVPERNFLCTLCGSVFKSLAFLRSHELTHKEAQFKCPTCGKFFWHKFQLRKHMDVHKGTRDLPCSEPGCNKFFQTRDSLQHHRLIHRKQDKVFTCIQCDKMFTHANHLAMHQRQVHLAEKTHRCPEKNCGLLFKSRAVLKRHYLRKHTTSDQTKCDVAGCDKVFSMKRDMLNHKLRIHLILSPGATPTKHDLDFYHRRMKERERLLESNRCSDIIQESSAMKPTLPSRTDQSILPSQPTYNNNNYKIPKRKPTEITRKPETTLPLGAVSASNTPKLQSNTSCYSSVAALDANPEVVLPGHKSRGNLQKKQRKTIEVQTSGSWSFPEPQKFKDINEMPYQARKPKSESASAVPKKKYKYSMYLPPSDYQGKSREVGTQTQTRYFKKPQDKKVNTAKDKSEHVKRRKKHRPETYGERESVPPNKTLNGKMKEQMLTAEVDLRNLCMEDPTETKTGERVDENVTYIIESTSDFKSHHPAEKDSDDFVVLNSWEGRPHFGEKFVDKRWEMFELRRKARRNSQTTSTTCVVKPKAAGESTDLPSNSEEIQNQNNMNEHNKGVEDDGISVSVPESRSEIEKPVNYMYNTGETASDETTVPHTSAGNTAETEKRLGHESEGVITKSNDSKPKEVDKFNDYSPPEKRPRINVLKLKSVFVNSTKSWSIENSPVPPTGKSHSDSLHHHNVQAQVKPSIVDNIQWNDSAGDLENAGHASEKLFGKTTQPHHQGTHQKKAPTMARVVLEDIAYLLKGKSVLLEPLQRAGHVPVLSINSGRNSRVSTKRSKKKGAKYSTHDTLHENLILKKMDDMQKLSNGTKVNSESETKMPTVKEHPKPSSNYSHMEADENTSIGVHRVETLSQESSQQSYEQSDELYPTPRPESNTVTSPPESVGFGMIENNDYLDKTARQHTIADGEISSGSKSPQIKDVSNTERSNGDSTQEEQCGTKDDSSIAFMSSMNIKNINSTKSYSEATGGTMKLPSVKVVLRNISTLKGASCKVSMVPLSTVKESDPPGKVMKIDNATFSTDSSSEICTSTASDVVTENFYLDETDGTLSLAPSCGRDAENMSVDEGSEQLCHREQSSGQKDRMENSLADFPKFCEEVAMDQHSASMPTLDEGIAPHQGSRTPAVDEIDDSFENSTSHHAEKSGGNTSEGTVDDCITNKNSKKVDVSLEIPKESFNKPVRSTGNPIRLPTVKVVLQDISWLKKTNTNISTGPPRPLKSAALNPDLSEVTNSLETGASVVQYNKQINVNRNEVLKEVQQALQKDEADPNLEVVENLDPQLNGVCELVENDDVSHSEKSTAESPSIALSTLESHPHNQSSREYTDDPLDVPSRSQRNSPVELTCESPEYVTPEMTPKQGSDMDQQLKSLSPGSDANMGTSHCQADNEPAANPSGNNSRSVSLSESALIHGNQCPTSSKTVPMIAPTTRARIQRSTSMNARLLLNDVMMYSHIRQQLRENGSVVLGNKELHRVSRCTDELTEDGDSTTSIQGTVEMLEVESESVEASVIGTEQTADTCSEESSGIESIDTETMEVMLGGEKTPTIATPREQSCGPELRGTEVAQSRRDRRTDTSLRENMLHIPVPRVKLHKIDQVVSQLKETEHISVQSLDTPHPAEDGVLEVVSREHDASLKKNRLAMKQNKTSRNVGKKSRITEERTLRKPRVQTAKKSLGTGQPTQQRSNRGGRIRCPVQELRRNIFEVMDPRSNLLRRSVDQQTGNNSDDDISYFGEEVGPSPDLPAFKVDTDEVEEKKCPLHGQTSQHTCTCQDVKVDDNTDMPSNAGTVFVETKVAVTRVDLAQGNSCSLEAPERTGVDEVQHRNEGTESSSAGEVEIKNLPRNEDAHLPKQEEPCAVSKCLVQNENKISEEIPVTGVSPRIEPEKNVGTAASDSDDDDNASNGDCEILDSDRIAVLSSRARSRKVFVKLEPLDLDSYVGCNSAVRDDEESVGDADTKQQERENSADDSEEICSEGQGSTVENLIHIKNDPQVPVRSLPKKEET